MLSVGGDGDGGGTTGTATACTKFDLLLIHFHCWLSLMWPSFFRHGFCHFVQDMPANKVTQLTNELSIHCIRHDSTMIQYLQFRVKPTDAIIIYFYKTNNILNNNILS